MSTFAFEMEERPRESRIFAEKAARTILEAQESLENVTDVAMLLEVMGVTREDLQKNGFKDTYDLAVYIDVFIEFYELKRKDDDDSNDELEGAPTTKKKLGESLAMIFPWLASLALFFVTGVSLFMAAILPADYITALMIGVFLGIFVTQGPMDVFQRLFLMNHSQSNRSEARRNVKRNFVLTSFTVMGCSSLLFLFGYLIGAPTSLVLLSIVSLVMVSLHRATYMIIYALKKLKILVGSYSAALALLASIYYLASDLIPDIIVRYLAALGAAFVVLCISSVYAYHKTFNSSPKHEAHPHFYKSPAGIKNAIKARIRIQLWDGIPYYVLGTFLFVMMFGDRLISWFFNPALHTSNTSLPLLFNITYHVGADAATLVFLVTSIAQYMITAGFYHEIAKITTTHKIAQLQTVDEFLKKRYRKLILVSITTSCCVAIVLNFAGAEIIAHLGASHVSLNILKIASVGNVFASIFMANIMFATFLNRIKALAIIAIFAALIVGLGGALLAQNGFENIPYAYLAAAILSAASSSAYMMRTIKNAPNIYFARFT